MISRREALRSAASLALPSMAIPAFARSGVTLDLPILRIMDKDSRSRPARTKEFFSKIWGEAVNTFSRGDISFRTLEKTSGVLQYPSGKPFFQCLDRSMINIVLCDRVPVDWDKGRSLAGISAVYEGYCVCVISMNEAHGNQVPFLSVNTVVHELLHVLLGDVFESRGGWIHSQSREARVDVLASRLWLFGDGREIRNAALRCLGRLRRTSTEPADSMRLRCPG